MLKTISSITNAIGALNYKGTWNASTNTPTLASGVGTKGDYYVVSVAGSTNLDGETLWGVGDWTVFNGSVWQKVDGGNTVNATNIDYTGTLTGGTGVINIGSGQVYKDASGNVGIGTVSPLGKFEVDGGRSTLTAISEPYSLGVRYNNTGGRFYIGAASASATPDMVFSAATGDERMRITDAGNVGIGTSSPLASAKQTIVFESGGSVSQAMTLISYGGNPTISFRQIGGTIASPTATNLANINFLGTTTNDGTNFFNTSQIVSTVESVPTAGSHPTTIFFSTTPSGSTSRSERMRITSSGAIGVGTSSPNASAIFDAQSTTRGVRFPNMDTTQKNAIASPAAGLMVFDTTLAKLCVYSGVAWETITSV